MRSFPLKDLPVLPVSSEQCEVCKFHNGGLNGIKNNNRFTEIIGRVYTSIFFLSAAVTVQVTSVFEKLFPII